MGDTLPPIMTSVGGFAYNGAHIDHWKDRALKAEATLRRASITPPGEIAGLASLLLGRIGQEFDGEAHLSEDEARSIATALSAMAGEVERQEANIARLTSNPADHRYWEGRYRDEAVAREAAEAKVAELTKQLEEHRHDER